MSYRLPAGRFRPLDWRGGQPSLEQLRCDGITLAPWDDSAIVVTVVPILMEASRGGTPRPHLTPTGATAVPSTVQQAL